MLKRPVPPINYCLPACRIALRTVEENLPRPLDGRSRPGARVAGLDCAGLGASVRRIKGEAPDNARPGAKRRPGSRKCGAIHNRFFPNSLVNASVGQQFRMLTRHRKYRF
jgi:hypothetical protein